MRRFGFERRRPLAHLLQHGSRAFDFMRGRGTLAIQFRAPGLQLLLTERRRLVLHGQRRKFAFELDPFNRGAGRFRRDPLVICFSSASALSR